MKVTNLMKGLNLKWLGLFLLFGVVISQNNCSGSSSGSKGNPPSAPTGVTATSGNAQVTLNWNKVSNAAAYNIYWSTTSGVTPANGTKIPKVTTPYTQTKLTNGTTYYYVVTAIDNSGESAPSSQVSATPSGSGGYNTLPASPTGVTATAGNGQITISWGTVTGATSYNVYDSTSSGGPYTKVGSATNPNYTVTGLNNGTIYYFVVTAVNSYGESGYSAPAVFATPTSGGSGLPAAPTGLTVEYVSTYGELFVSWNPVAGASTYNIYFSTTAGTEKTSGIEITGISRTSYVGPQNLTIGVTYYFVVTAVNSYGESSPSSEVSIVAGTPVQPYMVTAASDCSGNVTIIWYDLDPSVTYYNVYYSTTSGAEQTSGLKISGVTNTSTTIPGLTKGTAYYFVVTSVNSYGESTPSYEVRVIAGSPPPPTGVTATAENAQITINWSSVSCAASYNIYWSTTSGVTPQTGIEITNATSPYLQTGLTKGVAYYYVITAVNSYGEGAPSQEVYAIAGAYFYTVGTYPAGIAIDSSGNAWVANWGSNSVTELSSTGITIGTYTVGSNPPGIAIDSSGNAWVANWGSNSVTELSSTGIAIGTYAVGSNPFGIAINSSGNVWVANNGSNSVTELSSTGIAIGTYAIGSNPFGIAINSSGNVWVANNGSNNVTELSSTGIIIGTYAVGSGSMGIAIDSSGNVWVANYGSNNVTELSSTGITIGTYAVGYGPMGIAIDSSGNVWVANNGSNNVTELSSTGITIETYTVGTNPMGIAIDNSGNIWVANNGSNNVTELMGIAKGPQYFPYTGPQFPGGGNY